MSSSELQVNTLNKSIIVETKTALTFDIASALKKKILSGEALFKKDSPVVIEIETDTNGEISSKTIAIPANTVMSWIKRNMVIPDTKKTLRDYLNEAREERSDALTKRQKQEIKHLAVRELVKMVTMPIESNRKEIIVNYTKDKNGDDIEQGKAVRTTIGDDTEKMRLKAKNLHYILDHLDDDFKKRDEKLDNKPFTFSFLALAEKEKEMIRSGKLKR